MKYRTMTQNHKELAKRLRAMARAIRQKNSFSDTDASIDLDLQADNHEHTAMIFRRNKFIMKVR